MGLQRTMPQMQESEHGQTRYAQKNMCAQTAATLLKKQRMKKHSPAMYNMFAPHAATAEKHKHPTNAKK